MKNHLLAIKANCKGNDRCLFDGRDLFLEIRVTNTHKSEVGFPLAYVQKTGPIIKLIDTRTKAETYLRKNLADLDLQEKFTLIQPGQSVVMEWVITSGELEQFGLPVDLSAEITVKTGIRVDGRQVEFLGTDTVRILSKPNP